MVSAPDYWKMLQPNYRPNPNWHIQSITKIFHLPKIWKNGKLSPIFKSGDRSNIYVRGVKKGGPSGFILSNTRLNLFSPKYLSTSPLHPVAKMFFEGDPRKEGGPDFWVRPPPIRYRSVRPGGISILHRYYILENTDNGLVTASVSLPISPYTLTTNNLLENKLLNI